MEKRDTFVYILMSIFKFCSFHKVYTTEYYNNLKSITLIDII